MPGEGLAHAAAEWSAGVHLAGCLPLLATAGTAPLGCIGSPSSPCAAGGRAGLEEERWCLWLQVLQPVVQPNMAATYLLPAVPSCVKCGSGNCLSDVFGFCLQLQALFVFIKPESLGRIS